METSDTNHKRSPIYIKQRVAKVKKMQKTMQSLCDNDSSSTESRRSFFFKSRRDNSDDTSSDEDTINRLKQITTKENESHLHKQEKSKEHLETDLHKNNMRNKKADCNNSRKENDDSRDSVLSHSENTTYGKLTKKKTKTRSLSKSNQKDFTDLYQEKSDSNSDKEFQKSKISYTGLNTERKARKSRTMSSDSNLESTSQLTKKITINKEQSLQFKSHVLKIFNKFKTVCSEYELQMERVKWKYFKKELVYQESAYNVIRKSKSVINNLVMELNAQEEELINFYEEWNEHKIQGMDHEESSLSENEVAKETETKEGLDKSRNNSNAESVVSECDNDEIFSDEGTSVMKTNADKNRTNNDTITEVSEKSTDNSENNDQAISSILVNKEKNKTYMKDNSKADENEKTSKKPQIPTNEHILNESIDDIFKENTNENIVDINDSNEVEDERKNEGILKLKEVEKNNDNKDKNSLRCEKLNTELEDKNSCSENIKSESVPFKEDVKSTETKDDDVLDDIDAERQAKVALLESDSETQTNDELLAEKPTKSFDINKKLKMFAKIIVERLPKDVLKKYENALEKSREYLENKEFRSLIDLGRLQRNRKSAIDSIQNPSLKKIRKAKVQEIEDSLLDHLKNVEDKEFEENTEEDSNTENNSSITKMQTNFQTNKELMLEADAATKKSLLCSSDSDFGKQKESVSENSNSDDDENKSKLKNCSKQANQKIKKESNDEENDDNQKKNKWRQDKLLKMKLSSDSDSDVAREKWNKKQKEIENHTETPAIKNKVVKRERRKCRKIIDSDSDVQLLNSDTESSSSGNKSDSDFSVGKLKNMRKRKSRRSSDTDSSLAEKRTKRKRKRIKNMPSDSDESIDKDQITNSQGTPGKKGRKNIRKVMKDKQVTHDTKQAAKEEEERLKRISERQKLYNEMYEIRLAGEEKVDKLVLDLDHEMKEELVTVDKDLVKNLKPHQAKGIKFMWDSCFESLERIKSSTGSGCILAHCMGLGKSLQVIALVHTLLTYETGIKTVMIVCPLSTVLNWVNEFATWLKDKNDDIEIYEMTKLKKNIERRFQLETWQKSGGVFIIGYEMFRNLSSANKKMRKNMKEAVLQYLIDPGPDVIVCDEGHLLKNEDTALSKSMNRIRTLRRIVLTGTPLQNNLIEYHCMVQFVKPNLLGTKKEFLNRFANPITNGQFDDSTEYDVKLMKKRAYVLHKMLKGCVQRFDYSVLTPFLPPKQEYVIFVSLSEVQVNLYQHYLDNFARCVKQFLNEISKFNVLQRIWTHPWVLRKNAEKIEKMNEKRFTDDSEGSLNDFINDDDSDSTIDSSTSSVIEDHDDAQSVDEEPEKKEEEWWLQFVKPEYFEDMRISSKLILLFGILKECEQIGDKVLVFSQSLYSLSLIEHFLEKIDNATQNDEVSEYIDGHFGSWSLGTDYFRLDGQTSAENRNLWCKIFNEPSNTRARLFLISTRAGGLGINLTAANRVIIFDASWNPSHDVQSIFRIYRFGQRKPCYVYRFLAAGTMEEKIYNRQVTKLSLSCRVVDEQQIERHYSNHDLSELYTFERNNGEKRTLNLPKDILLAEIFLKYKNFVENHHEHDSLLENKAEEELNEEERKQAWLEYEEEKKGKPPAMPSYSANNMMAFPNMPNMMLNQYNMASMFTTGTDIKQLQELLRKDYPNTTPETQKMMTASVLTKMYNYWEQHSLYNTNRMVNQNPNVNPVQIRTQIPNLARVSYVVPNTNKNLTNQSNNYRTNDIRTENIDDDVIEVTSTTVNNKNKNQEE
ncbi:Transcriptional regulator ATRX like protein [Melipona quadrifasciata]|uniref:Transcriptional regulator ATRX like protein n=1 Tax=Melipona quadrifasciata TaxID=166423 RepID=A0A0M9ABP2_9HYME|nr:Transcriptional regulator ATRX like protein [Melipona quadrifasciata]